jgi:hypothetical protein
MVKICTTCRISKEESEFHKHRGRKDGLQPACRECMKQWVSSNRSRSRAIKAKWRSANLAYWTERQRRLLRDDPEFKLKKTLRRRFHMALKRGTKAGSAVRDLGCTIAMFREYLEARFYPHPKTGEVMSWENWSRTGWHIDHKRPLANFDLTDRVQLLKACHYTNLQPLWAEENMAKGAREAAQN